MQQQTLSAVNRVADIQQQQLNIQQQQLNIQRQQMDIQAQLLETKKLELHQEMVTMRKAEMMMKGWFQDDKGGCR